MQDKIQEYIENLDLKKNENGVFECPFCSYTARSKKMMQNHLKGHDKEILQELGKKEQQAKQSEQKQQQNKRKPQKQFYDIEIRAYNCKKCKVKMNDGTIIIGTVAATYKYTIQLKNAILYENGNETKLNTIHIHKGMMTYIYPLE